jgi:hypothetical protein
MKLNERKINNGIKNNISIINVNKLLLLFVLKTLYTIHKITIIIKKFSKKVMKLFGDEKGLIKNTKK